MRIEMSVWLPVKNPDWVNIGYAIMMLSTRKHSGCEVAKAVLLRAIEEGAIRVASALTIQEADIGEPIADFSFWQIERFFAAMKTKASIAG